MCQPRCGCLRGSAGCSCGGWSDRSQGPVRRGATRALLAGLLLAATGSAWGLGLGEIELDSALNEKLDAAIELYDAKGLQPTEVLVSLASADDFERVGVERFFFLTDLRFEVDFRGGAVQGITVSSTQPVTEPYLNFLVEVLWPNGRLLKEYTLLLDPPTFSPAAAPMVSAPSQASQQDGGAGRVQRSTPEDQASGRGTRVQLAPGSERRPSPFDEDVVDGEFRMTDRNDTLWTIAARTRPSDAVSVKQNMLAIQQLNPEAFLNDNINLLKAGYRLRLPTEAQALSTSGSEADRQVAMQNEDWRALRNGEAPAQRQVANRQAADEQPMQAQIDATPARAGGTAAAAGGNGELRIVAGSGESVGGSADPASAEALNAAREEQDRLSREVESLTEQVDREQELASNQIAVKDRQLEVKDQQIAEMQAQIERLREEMERAEAAAPQSQNQNASVSAPWWQSPLVLGGALGVVVLLLVYALIAARRRRAAAEEFYPELTEEPAFAAAEPEAADTMEAVEAPAMAAGAALAAHEEDADEPTVAFDEPDDTVAEAPRVAADPDASEGSQTGDVIGEADIYIAYGRYPQAIGLLLGVLEEAPERNDVRLKLLELYAETRDREAFDGHMAELTERCNDAEALRTARELANQFGAGEDEAEAPVSLDELTTDADTDRLDGAGQSPVDALADPSADAADADLPGSADLDEASAASADGDEFELELDDLGQPAEAERGDALGGDLGIDFDPEHTGNGAGLDDLDVADDLAEHDDLENLDQLEGGAGLDLDLDLDDVDALGDDAFDFGDDDGDTASTKLDLARAYIDMGDQDGARDILNEVVAEGSSEQQERAQAMLEEL